MWKKKRWWFIIACFLCLLFIFALFVREAVESGSNPFLFLLAIIQLELTDKDLVLISDSHPKLYVISLAKGDIETVFKKRGWSLDDRMGNAFFFQKGDQNMMIIRSGWIYNYMILKGSD